MPPTGNLNRNIRRDKEQLPLPLAILGVVVERSPEDTARECGGRSRTIVEVEGGSRRPVVEVLVLDST